MAGAWSTRLYGAALTALLAPAALVCAGLLARAAGVGDVPGRAAVVGTGVVVALVLAPAYSPEPLRPLDRGKRVAFGVAVAIGFLGLAGYAGLQAVPAPATLLLAAALLGLVLPAAYTGVRRLGGPGATVVVGDDGAKIRSVAATLGARSRGFCAPTSTRLDGENRAPTASTDADQMQPDGGAVVTESGVRRIAGLSQLRAVLAEHDVEELALAFSDSDRQEFFGALRVCHAHGVAASVHHSHARSVLVAGEPAGESDDRLLDGSVVDADTSGDGPIQATDGGDVVDGAVEGDDVVDRTMESSDVVDRTTEGSDVVEAAAGVERASAAVAAEPTDDAGDGPDERAGTAAAVEPPDELVQVDVEPWSWHSRLCKRAFDVAFATAGLVALAPLIAVIAVAIKLDTPGPVLYGQTRTAELGGTFQLYKFRSMVADAEDETGPRLSDEDAGDVDPRVTRVGRALRATHLDELPQLLAVLRGEMSVVGPRPERPGLDAAISAQGIDWERRWFVTPGLTGLAQINDCTGFEPERKLAYDLAYARRQSLALDVRIVLAQIRIVLADVVALLRSRVSRS